MIDILILVANESLSSKNIQIKSSDEFIVELKHQKTKQINNNSDEDSSTEPNAIVDLTQEDFLMWNIENSFNLVQPFLDLLFEICHIVLGLRPQCRHLEHDIGLFLIYIRILYIIFLYINVFKLQLRVG